MSTDTPLEEAFRLIKTQRSALKKLRLNTVGDLLFHFPVRYESIADEKPISLLKKGDVAIFHGIVEHIKKTRAFRKRMIMTEATIKDHTGHIKAIWFHQPYIAEKLKDGGSFQFSGKVGERKEKLYIANPEFQYVEHAHPAQEKILQNGETLLYPVYPESRGITSKWFYHALKKIMQTRVHENILDPIPEHILKTYHLPQLKTALVWIHAPQKESHSISARKRFAFEEVFFIQLARQKARHEYKNNLSYKIARDEKRAQEFVARFPFAFTRAQEKAIDTILSDFEKREPMSRLLEGDVGSGKTAVAATSAYAVVTSRPQEQNFGNLQVAYMAPTEILAQQHFESFMEYFSHLPIQIGLITGSGCKKFPSKINPKKATDISRTQLLKWVKNGEIPILIGTHSLIQKTVSFKHLAFVIIDEQHRFGVRQRQALARGKKRTERGSDAEGKIDPLLYRDLTYRIRNAIFEVKKTLGLGHKESIYQQALVEEFNKNKLSFKQQIRIPIFYHSKKIGAYIPDFVIEDKVVVELKALPFLGDQPKKQLWQYLKGSPYRLGLLVNFGSSELAIERIVYDKARTPIPMSTPHNSASSPHDSAFVPHLLSMTATPIPRTLALTIYGDLDLTLLDEMPRGRKPVMTQIVFPKERERAYERVREELSAGRQAYIICPKIEIGTGILEVKNVTDEAARLKKEVFPEYTIGILHSKLKPTEKEKMMEQFLAGTVHILVATSVIEVGVNIPNATTIIIEGADRFGLAQLHQLRGRVLRSNHQAYCYIFADTKSKNSLERLRALTRAKNGFELAELDLTLRGSGELSGRKQWGISDIGMEAIKNIKMVEAARTEAQDIIKTDPEFKQCPLIKERAERTEKIIHFE
ncbi:MAG: GxxExxY protein [bacterium]|nr:GxxExxY protein [bacterium]